MYSSWHNTSFLNDFLISDWYWKALFLKLCILLWTEHLHSTFPKTYLNRSGVTRSLILQNSCLDFVHLLDPLFASFLSKYFAFLLYSELAKLKCFLLVQFRQFNTEWARSCNNATMLFMLHLRWILIVKSRASLGCYWSQHTISQRHNTQHICCHNYWVNLYEVMWLSKKYINNHYK